MTELGLVLPIMLLLLVLVFDFGQGFRAYVSVTNGARDGARVAMDTADDAKIRAAAIAGAKPFTVATPTVSHNAGKTTVTVSLTYTPILPFVTSSFTFCRIGLGLRGGATLAAIWKACSSLSRSHVAFMD